MRILVADALESSIADFVQWKEAMRPNVTIRKMSESATPSPRSRPSFKPLTTTRPRGPRTSFCGDETTVVPDHRSTSSGNAAQRLSLHAPQRRGGRRGPGHPAGAHHRRQCQPDQHPDGQDHPLRETAGCRRDASRKSAPDRGNEGSAPPDEEYITSITDTLLANTYNYRDHWFQGDGNATAANINAGLTEGRTWLTYIGHGSGTSWGSTNDTYNNSSIDGMNNGYKMPILVDVACENGSFDDATECFGEKWMRAGSVGTPRGAVGYYGGTVNISWDPPAIMARGIAIHHYLNPVFTWGGSCLAGQMYLTQIGGGAETIDNFEWHILFGTLR
jgi:hypothetical protein